MKALYYAAAFIASALSAEAGGLSDPVIPAEPPTYTVDDPGLDFYAGISAIETRTDWSKTEGVVVPCQSDTRHKRCKLSFEDVTTTGTDTTQEGAIFVGVRTAIDDLVLGAEIEISNGVTYGELHAGFNAGPALLYVGVGHDGEDPIAAVGGDLSVGSSGLFVGLKGYTDGDGRDGAAVRIGINF